MAHQRQQRICAPISDFPTHYTLHPRKIKVVSLGKPRLVKPILGCKGLAAIARSRMKAIMYLVFCSLFLILLPFGRNEVWYQLLLLLAVTFVVVSEMARMDRALFKLIAFQFSTWFMLINALMFSIMHYVCRVENDAMVAEKIRPPEIVHAISSVCYFLVLSILVFIDSFLDMGIKRTSKRLYLFSGLSIMALLEIFEVLGWSDRYTPVTWKVGTIEINSESAAFSSLNNVLAFLAKALVKSLARPDQLSSVLIPPTLSMESRGAGSGDRGSRHDDSDTSDGTDDTNDSDSRNGSDGVDKQDNVM